MSLLPQDELEAIIHGLCGDHDVTGVKYMPLYPQNKCHANCFNFCEKNSDYISVRGWVLKYGQDRVGVKFVGLVYHSIVSDMGLLRGKKKSTLVDITDSLDDSSCEEGFIRDMEWLNGVFNDPTFKYHDRFKPNYMINLHTGEVSQWMGSSTAHLTATELEDIETYREKHIVRRLANGR